MNAQYTSLDGKTYTLSEWQQSYLDVIVFPAGYTRVLPLKGGMGWTELGMHMRRMDTPAICAWVKPEWPNCASFAYVLLSDDTITSGCLHQYSDGGFSLA